MKRRMPAPRDPSSHSRCRPSTHRLNRCFGRSMVSPHTILGWPLPVAKYIHPATGHADYPTYPSGYWRDIIAAPSTGGLSRMVMDNLCKAETMHIVDEQLYHCPESHGNPLKLAETGRVELPRQLRSSGFKPGAVANRLASPIVHPTTWQFSRNPAI